MNLSSVEKEAKDEWKIAREQHEAEQKRKREERADLLGPDGLAFVSEAGRYDWHEIQTRESDIKFFGLTKAKELSIERYSAQEARNRVHMEEQRIASRNRYANTLCRKLPADAAVALSASEEEGVADSKAYRLIKEWQVGDRFGLFLLGPSGCGKSFALFTIIKKIIEHPGFFTSTMTISGNYEGHEICWFPVAAGLDKIRSEFEETSKTKKELMSSPFAFFDDLGAENLTEWAREQLYLIIEHRLNRGLVTFFSTNCTLTEIKTRYHERFISRIKEMCVVIEMKGADRRTDKMKNHLETLKERMIGEANEKH